MPGLDGEMGRSVVLQAAFQEEMERNGWVARRGKAFRADRMRWLVGWGKGDKEEHIAQSRSDWAPLAMDGIAMASD